MTQPSKLADAYVILRDLDPGITRLNVAEAMGRCQELLDAWQAGGNGHELREYAPLWLAALPDGPLPVREPGAALQAIMDAEPAPAGLYHLRDM